MTREAFFPLKMFELHEYDGLLGEGWPYIRPSAFWHGPTQTDRMTRAVA